MEFGAETLGIGSTNELIKTCEYELLTPSELEDRALYIFGTLFFPKKKVSHPGNELVL